MATTYYSAEHVKQTGVPPTNLHTTEWHGRIRFAVATVTFTGTPAANDVVYLTKMPAGKTKVLGPLCGVNPSANVAGTVDIGHAGYTNQAGTAVVADVDAFVDGLTVAAAGFLLAGGTNAIAEFDETTDLIDARDPWDLTAKILTAAPAAAAIWRFQIAYVVD